MIRVPSASATRLGFYGLDTGDAEGTDDRPVARSCRKDQAVPRSELDVPAGVRE